MINQTREELMKRAEMSLREAPANTTISVPPIIRDGRVYHPNLTSEGYLRKKKRK